MCVGAPSLQGYACTTVKYVYVSETYQPLIKSKLRLELEPVCSRSRGPVQQNYTTQHTAAMSMFAVIAAVYKRLSLALCDVISCDVVVSSSTTSSEEQCHCTLRIEFQGLAQCKLL
jgi:hypothetical protein